MFTAIPSFKRIVKIKKNKSLNLLICGRRELPIFKQPDLLILRVGMLIKINQMDYHQRFLEGRKLMKLVISRRVENKREQSFWIIKRLRTLKKLLKKRFIAEIFNCVVKEIRVQGDLQLISHVLNWEILYLMMHLRRQNSPWGKEFSRICIIWLDIIRAN